MLGSRTPKRITIEGSDILLPMDLQATLNVIIARSLSPLGANESYESEWVDISTKGGLVYVVNTDADGTLKIQHSIDGEEVDYEDVVSVTGGAAASDMVIRRALYARVVYENGATVQTKFRLLVTAMP